MKKKDLKIIIFTILGVILASLILPFVIEQTLEFIDRTSPQPTIMAIGPNGNEERYFYRTTCNENGDDGL